MLWSAVNYRRWTVQRGAGHPSLTRVFLTLRSPVTANTAHHNRCCLRGSSVPRTYGCSIGTQDYRHWLTTTYSAQRTSEPQSECFLLLCYLILQYNRDPQIGTLLLLPTTHESSFKIQQSTNMFKYTLTSSPI